MIRFQDPSAQAHHVQIESGRTLGGGPHEAEQLHIVPLVFVGVASKWLGPQLKLEELLTRVKSWRRAH